MKRFYLFLITFLTGSIIQAQTLLVPVKDSVSGLTGYKKAGSKHWYIKPSFESAEWFFTGSAVVRKGEKYGLLLPSGKFILNPEYDFFQGDYLLAFRKNDSAGVADRKGKILFFERLDHLILDEERGSAILMKDTLFGYWDTSGVYIAPFSYYELMFSAGLAYYESDGRKGFLNGRGEKIIETSEGELMELSGKGFVLKNGSQTFYNGKGKNLGSFEKIIQVTDSIVLYRSKSNCGIMRKDGKILSEADEIKAFNSKGISCAIRNGKYGIINNQGKEILPFEYDHIENFCEVNKNLTDLEKEKEFVVFRRGDVYGVLNAAGKIAAEPQYKFAKTEEELLWYTENDSLKFLNIYSGKKVRPSEVLHFNLKRAVVCMSEDSTCGLIDPAGKFVVPPVAGNIKDLYNTYYMVSTQEGTGLLDSSGQYIIKPEFHTIKILGDIQPSGKKEFVSDNFLYLISKSGLTGIAKMDGEILSDTIWQNSSVFDEDGKCFFVKNKKGSWDMIGITGKKYSLGIDTPSVFSEGYAVVRKKGKYGLINFKGKKVVPAKYQNIVHQINGLNYYQQNGLWGLLSEKGKIITEPVYVHLTEFRENIALVQRRFEFRANSSDTWGMLDSEGNYEPEFKKLYGLQAYRLLGTDNKKAVPFSMTYLKGFDEVYFELIADSSAGKSKDKEVNNLILKEISGKLGSMPDVAIPLLVKNIYTKNNSTYSGMGIEIKSLTTETASLEFYRENLIESGDEVEDTIKVYWFSDNSLKRIYLSDLFIEKNWISYLNEVIASKLREKNYRAIPSHGSLIFFDQQNFAITPEGLILKLNETALGLSNDYSGQEMLIEFKEVEEIVKKDGVLREFYK